MEENYILNDTIVGSSGTDTISFGAAQPAHISLNDWWQFDGISLTGNTSYSPDTITFNTTPNEPDWKYNEGRILEKLKQYLSSTYNQHYSDGNSGEQTLDKIKGSRKEGFFAGNVVKYIDRYDSKGTPRQDLFKVLHYTMLLIDHLDLIEEN